MTRYYVVKNKTNDFFEYGTLYYTDSPKVHADNLLLTPADNLTHTQQVIIPASYLVEVDEEQYESIKQASSARKISVVNDIIQLNTSVKVGVIREGHEVLPSGEEIPSIRNVSMFVSGPSGAQPDSLTKEDIWGEYDLKSFEKISDGMVVARSEQVCPHFNDTVPYKSVTVVCEEKLENEVEYWLEYVHGANSISRRKELSGNRIALRSDYQCW